jgi:hypothetical protein
MLDEHHLILRQATENILSAVAPTRQHRIAGLSQVILTLGTFTFGESRVITNLDISDQEGKQIYEVIIPVADVACISIRDEGGAPARS